MCMVDSIFLDLSIITESTITFARNVTLVGNITNNITLTGINGMQKDSV